MTDVGDNAAQASRRPAATPPPTPSGQTPTQEIPRTSTGDGRQVFEETGKVFPVPATPGTRSATGATAPAAYPPGAAVPSAAVPSATPPPGAGSAPSDAERAKTLKAQQKAAATAAKSARQAAARRPRQTRRAKLRLTRVDPWSVTKTAFLLSIAFGVMCVVAIFLVFSIMSASGLWDKVNETIQSVVNQDPASQFNIKDYVAMSRVMGITMLISVIDVVLITALATLGAFIYNMSAAMLGGVEITLAEDLD